MAYDGIIKIGPHEFKAKLCATHNNEVMAISRDRISEAQHDAAGSDLDKAFDGIDHVLLGKEDAEAIIKCLNEVIDQRCEAGKAKGEFKDGDYDDIYALGETAAMAYERLIDRLEGLIYERPRVMGIKPNTPTEKAEEEPE